MRAAADRVRAWLAVLGPLGAGSRALVLRLLERFGWKIVGGGALLAVYVAFRYRTWIVWVLVAWCAAAWMHAPDDEAAGTVEEENPAEPPADPFPGMVRDLIGDAPGVHIKHIVGWLHESGLDTACTAADVRAGLGRRGIPVRASVRDALQRVNQGVHRDDLDAWFEARSPAPSVSLSKARSGPATTGVTSDVADLATGVATPPTAAD